MKSPSFRFYASDFLGSPTVQLMDASEVGAYILLLCMAWENDRHGFLPDDDEKLRRWSRLSREQWTQSRELVLSKFPIAEEGLRANPRMKQEAEKQRLYSEAQSLRGKAGGRGNKKDDKSERFSEESSRFPEQSERLENESPVKPAVVVAATVVKKQIQEPSAVSLDGRNAAQVLRMSIGMEDAETIWKLWPNKGGKQEGLRSIHRALKHLGSSGSADPVADLTARVETWLAWHAKEIAAGRFVAGIGYAQGWFGDRQKRYLDPAAESPAETMVLVDGKLVPQSECEADGWVVVKGDS